MAATRLNAGDSGNRNSSDSSPSKVPIVREESELFKARLKEVVGEETLVAFAKQCGFSDSLLGSYLRGEKLPGLGNLVAMADAGNVTVDWLATGRPPKTRAELRAMVALQAQGGPAAPAPPSSAPAINVGALQALIEGTLKVAPNAPVSAQAAHIAKVYKDLIDKGMITAEGMGTGHLDAVA
jgi:transcriptional regulator with XRE-family HTH domain